MDRINDQGGGNRPQVLGDQARERPNRPLRRLLGRRGQAQPQQPNNRLLNDNQRNRLEPLNRREGRVIDRPFRPNLSPVREPSPQPVAAPLRRQNAVRIVAIAEQDRPQARQALDRPLRQAIRSAVELGQQRKDVSQTFLASRAYFGESFANTLNELRHLLKADQFDAAQFPELSNLLGNNQLFNATGQALYEATAAPDPEARVAKLLSLNDTLSALNDKVQVLSSEHNAWKGSVSSRINAIAASIGDIVSGANEPPQAFAEAKDPAVRSALVEATLAQRSFSPPESLLSLTRNLGQQSGTKVFQVQQLLKTVGQPRHSLLDHSAMLEKSVSRYRSGNLNDKGFVNHLKALSQSVGRSSTYTQPQKQAVATRIQSVIDNIQSKQTPSAKAQSEVQSAFSNILKEKPDTADFARAERHFARTALVIGDVGQEHAIDSHQAAARLVALDQVRDHPDAVLPPSQSPSLLSLFNSAHTKPQDRTVLEATLESLKSDIQKSQFLAGQKAEYLSLIATVTQDIEAHFHNETRLSTHAPAELTAWLDDFGHDIPKANLENLHNALSLLGAPKSEQVNFITSVSRYLHPETNTQTQAPYQLLKEDGAALLTTIERARVDSDIKDLAFDAVRKVVSDISTAKPQAERNYTAYRARGGDTFTPNVLSPRQRHDYDHWAAVITAETGIERNPLRTAKPGDALKVAQVWTNHLSGLREDFREDYAQHRNQLARDGRYGASVVMMENALVCRELSVVASALFAEFGIETQVGAGFVLANTERPGAHAWLEVVDQNDQVDMVVDSNFKRQTYTSFDAYDRASQGVTYRQDPGGAQQKIVQIKQADMYQDMVNQAYNK